MRKAQDSPALPDKPKRMGRPTDYRPEFCQDVEDAMGKGYSFTAWVGMIGVSRQTVDNWKNTHTDFFEAVSRAKAKRLLQWETASLRVAERGGGPGTATIIVFGLKNMGGDEWADKSEVKNTGDPANPIVHRIERVVVDPPKDEGL